jgi:hypothetical protein
MICPPNTPREPMGRHKMVGLHRNRFLSDIVP